VSVSIAAIVLAGGSGSRVHEDVNKVYMPIGERPMLAYSLDTLDRFQRVDQVIVVAREEDRHQAETLVDEVISSKPTRIAKGGSSRHLSEVAGLGTLREEIADGSVDLIAIHDGARPFVTLQLLDDLVDAAVEHDGAIPGLPIVEPLYRVGADDVDLLEPGTMRRVQTPQVFRAEPLLAAYDASLEVGFEGVDTAETVERFSDVDVMVVPGDPRNIKVTFVEDFYTAEEYATQWERGAWV
jgi:2-C-methyl-D-erythritol 4-phosphate cytidylyltransferase